MSDFLPPTEWLNGLGTVGVCVLVMLSVITGKGGLALLREVKVRDAEIAHNRETIRELASQNSILIQERAAAVNALDAMRRVAEGMTP